MGGEDKFIDGNITRAEYTPEQIILRAHAKCRPQHITTTLDGVTYPAVRIANKYYVPNRNKRE